MRHALVLALLGLPAATLAQQSVTINLTDVRLQNGLAQTRSSAPSTISPSFRYTYAISGSAVGSGFILGTLFPNPTPLAQIFETLQPGSSAFLNGTADNCPGTHPVSLSDQPLSGSQVLLGITINFAANLTTGIDASNFATFSLTNVVLTPSSLVGSLRITTGSAVITRVPLCPTNCDNSTSPPVLNVNDFICFLNKFSTGDVSANCDCSAVPPVLNVNDFVCFSNQFAAGCS
ncbi:MAG: GC-type dockerin domain-anchored protein [Phycisphaerales bacterium]